MSGFFWRIFVLLNSLKKGGVLIHKNSFASCQLVSSKRRVALWRFLSNKIIQVFGHCWVDIPPLNITLGFSKLCVSTVTVPPSDSDYVNGSASLQQFRFIHTRRAQRSRSDEGGHQYQALHRFILREVLACRRRRARLNTKHEVGRERFAPLRRRREETAWKWRWIKTSLVVVMFLLRVMTCVVFYKPFWNWSGVVRFVSHEVWSDKGFVIWH